MKLYYSQGVCSFAPHILLKETGLPHELVRVDLGSHRTQDGLDYYTVNPKGSVPVLELDNGERLTEGPVIAQYICDQAKRQDLMPAPGTMARYRVMEWQNYITSELHKTYSALFNSTLDATAKGVFLQALGKKYAWLDEQLRGKQYLTGDVFTAADAYLYTVSAWAKFVKLDLAPYTEVQRYLAQVGERPAVRAAQQAEAKH